MTEVGDLTFSNDSRDDPTQLFVIVETDIPTTTGMACKVRPILDPLAVYRLERNLRMVEE